MLDYDALFALAAVLRTGSFDRAAAQLGVTPSAVSQRIKGLEDRMGATLVLRGQPCAATPTGARLLRHLDDVALMEQGLARDLGTPASPRPTVRIAVNADSLATWFLPAIARVPDMLFELEIDDQDHSDVWLRKAEVAAAVTARATPVQGCDSIPLGTLSYIATASPGFAARWFPKGATATALGQAPALVFSLKDRLQQDWVTKVAGQRVALPAHRIASSHDFRRAAILGLGWGMNPEPLVAEDIAAGRLVAIAPETMETPLYWQVSRLSAPALAPLTRAIRETARKMLLQSR